MSYQILRGDCLAVLKTLPDSSFDSIVTDPPYELGFMGKAWDASGIANSVEMWREALRVLKPGGHLLAFSGSRTYHRMACAIEDGGFEIRDQIMWLYGSGFPKSLDVSKAIDKAGPSPGAPFAKFGDHYAECRKVAGLTHAQICAAGSWYGAVNHGGASVNWEKGYAMPTPEQWDVLQPMLGLGIEWQGFVREEFEREVVGSRKVSKGLAFSSEGASELDITAPATDAARQWEGWGTALKPAHEPICVARKPLIGTVAANVLAHGVGALNIDGCRVGTETVGWGGARGGSEDATQSKGRNYRLGEGEARPVEGRWPANLVHDGSDEVLAAFPDAKGQQGATAARSQGDVYGTVNAGQIGVKARNDAGTWRCPDCGNGADFDHRGCEIPAGPASAARFFYCAKASKSDRGPGNTHPTVKPLALMRYLLRLVTPPGGRALDPFAGSGSTIVAGLQEGFDVTGIELTPEYADIAESRAQEEYLGDLI